MLKRNENNNENNELRFGNEYMSEDREYKLSHKAKFTGFKHRTKVEALRFFIV